MYEPGSTFKIVAVSGALNERVVRLSDRFNCENGRYYYAGKVLRDHHGYDQLTVEEIITKSSNIGTAKVAMRMGGERLHRYISQLGFGAKTGVSLPGEIKGLLHPYKKWNKLSISRIPMGHEIAATPIQLTMAMSAVANGGRLMRPMLVEKLTDREGKPVVQYEPAEVRKRSATRRRADGRGVDHRGFPNGTARQAWLENYLVAGNRHGAKPAKNRRGYEPGKYFASFTISPARKPELYRGVCG